MDYFKWFINKRESSRFGTEKPVDVSLGKYLARRVVISLLLVWVITSLNFVLFELAFPWGPQDMYRGSLEWTEDMRNTLVELWGHNEPLYIRYLRYIKNMFTLNFGYSLHTMTPIIDEMAFRLSTTILLLGSALSATFIIGTTLGIFAASKRGSKRDVLTIGCGMLTWAIPIFLLQTLLLLVFSFYSYKIFGYRVFPLRGLVDLRMSNVSDILAYTADMAWHLALPVTTIVLVGFGGLALWTRNLLLDSLTQDYVVTARAKGLTERTVLYRHAFRGTLPPIVTMLAMSVQGMISGSMITEYIFTLPGIGYWFYKGLMGADYPVVESVLFMYGVLTVFGNLVCDLIYGIVDPRIRVGAAHGK